MKQGQATTSSSGSTKVEPKAKAVNVSTVAEMGGQYIGRAVTKQLYEGRGLQAPMKSVETHHCGSQGRHK